MFPKTPLALSPEVVKYSEKMKRLLTYSRNTSGIFNMPVKPHDLSRVNEWAELYDEWMINMGFAEFRTDNKLKEWERITMSGLDDNGLLSMLDAAKFFEIPDLIQCIRLLICEWIYSKSPKELERIFNIKPPFTEEEKAKIEAARKLFWQKNGGDVEMMAMDADTNNPVVMIAGEKEVGAVGGEVAVPVPAATDSDEVAEKLGV